MSDNCPLCRDPYPTTEAVVLERLQRRVSKGDPEAQLSLGDAYKAGSLGLNKSMERAVQYFELSAVQGHKGGQHNLAVCFYQGAGGVKIDKKQALKYYTLASEQGLAEAQCNCGGMYYNGEGTERDVKKALILFELAAAQGHQAAQDNLAVPRDAYARR